MVQIITMLNSLHIKKLATEIGFDLCGVTACRHLTQNEVYFRAWLDKGYHSSLEYLTANLDKRFDTSRLVENARSVIVCGVSYKNRISEGYPEGFTTKVASYACTTDYHTTIKQMLHALAARLTDVYPTLKGRAFTDSAPLLEKQLAVDAGLGWIGRQSLLITPQYGSFILLGELVVDAECDIYDSPFEGARCGRCNNCINSCPTQAIVAPKSIDTARCISCHTVEREPSSSVDLDGWIFGCDRCQSCCPYNVKAPEHRNTAFDPTFDPLAMTRTDWLTMSDEEFDHRFGTTPLKRSGLARIKANITHNKDDMQ